LLLLIFGMLPIIAISWVPLLKLRPYLTEVRDRNDEETHRKLAQFAAGSPDATQLDLKAKAIEQACIWPNGDTTGWLFFVMMIVIATLAVLPPFAAYVVGLGIVSTLVKVVPLPWAQKDSK
jgi:hypothetical protein